MTVAVVEPVVLPATPPRGDRSLIGPRPGLPAVRRALPLPTVPTPRTGATVYGLAAVDCRGRVADRVVLRALGWAAGTRLDIRETDGLLVIRPEARGGFSVTIQGHLRLPAPLRRRCGLRGGDRVLLVADPPRDHLVVHPPTALDAMLGRCHAELLDGELA